MSSRIRDVWHHFDGRRGSDAAAAAGGDSFNEDGGDESGSDKAGRLRRWRRADDSNEAG
uniref:Uncharacterized protein n=1 Tax=Leersia perrieri TaxID=77586 RepID=A0A0D9X7C6_9ORYZ